MPGRIGRLGQGQRLALYLGGGALTLLLLCCGGVAVVGLLAGDPQPSQSSAGDQQAAPPAPAVAAETSPAPAATSPAPQPQRSTKTVTETRAIPYATKTVKDPSLPAGTRKVRTKGIPGVKTLTYEVTLTDGVQTDKRLVRESVTKRPVTQVVAVGTKSVSRCDPNYSGACVPIASDVDCAGGSGDGPAYVSGPVKVIGDDIYDLDRDNDGYGCE